MNPTVYVHDLDPVIWQITDSIALRWYGLAYLMGFIGGYYLLSWLSRRKLYPVPQDRMADFVTYVAIFGVLIGGRLGYVLFYQIPNHGWSQFLADPLMVLRVWEGGMASHGGMIGVGLYTFYYAWKHRVKWVALLDGLAIVAPVGLFFGRMANFVRVASRIYETPGLLDKLSLSGIAVPERMTAAWVTDRVRDTPAIREIVGRMMQDHARYPSQLYEAFAEGVLLFAVLWFVRVRFPRAWNGLFCGIFAVLYAAGRIICEEYREPDSPFSMGLTRGQFLSVFLVLVGAAFFVYAFKTRQTVQECAFYEPEKKDGKESSGKAV